MLVGSTRREEAHVDGVAASFKHGQVAVRTPAWCFTTTLPNKNCLGLELGHLLFLGKGHPGKVALLDVANALEDREQFVVRGDRRQRCCLHGGGSANGWRAKPAKINTLILVWRLFC